MARPRHYSPTIRRDLVTRLYFRAKAEKVPMTELTNRLLDQALAVVEPAQSVRVAETPPSSPTPKPSE